MQWDKHLDTFVILATLGGLFYWADGKFEKVNDKISDLAKEISMIKTVLIVRGIMPGDFAVKPEEIIK